MQPYRCGPEYCVLCRRWKSQLEFFGLETAFLYDLFDRYPMRSFYDGQYEKLKQACNELYLLKECNNELQLHLSDQLEQLSVASQDDANLVPISRNQASLESSVNKLISEYQELFDLIGSVMHQNNASRKLVNMTE